MDALPPPNSILETILYASDLDAAHAFYSQTLGLSPLRESPSELAAGFRVSDNQVLLIFNPDVSDQPDRVVPSHGHPGRGHIGLRISPAHYDAWITRFRDANIEIEHEHRWEPHGRSIYVRDPAGNSVELIDTDIWPDNR